jgi:hypothetical protein
VITLDLPVTLGIKRAGADVCHAGDFDKGIRQPIISGYP